MRIFSVTNDLTDAPLTSGLVGYSVLLSGGGLPSGAILTESGTALTTESGDTLIIE